MKIKDKYGEPQARFMASKEWFNRFKHCAGFHSIKVCGEATSANSAAAEKFCDVLQKIIDEDSIQRNKFLTLTRLLCTGKNAGMHIHCQRGKGDAMFRGFKREGNALV